MLQYPDQTIALEWRKGDSVMVTFEGMKPVGARFNTSEGQTQFMFEGKTYFFVSDPSMAARELRRFHGN